MSKKIFEEAPPEVGGGLDKIRKAARQLAYDTKYKVKKSMGANVSRLSPAAVSKAYLSQLAKSPAPGPVKALAQKMLLGQGVKEEYDLDTLASSTVANALYKVFVEGVSATETVTEEENKNSGDETFLIVVTDKKTGNEYRRKANRAKIAELRANPNIARVEITKYGTPYKGEAEQGQQTAAVKSGQGLAKKDYDGDGKKESSAKEYRGAVHNAIQRKTGGKPDGQDTSSVRESKDLPGNQDVLDVAEPKGKLTKADFDQLRKTRKKVHESFFEQKVATQDQNTNEIVSNEEKGVDNYKTKTVKVFPEMGGSGIKESALGRFHEMIQERKMTKAEKAKEEKIGKKTKKKALPAMQAEYGDKKGTEIYYAWKRKQAMKEAAESGMDEKPKLKKSEGAVDDVRAIPTKVNLVKNKLRAMGLKCSYEPEGEQIDEMLPALAAGAALLAAPAVVKAVFDKPVKKALDNATNDPNRRLVTGGTVGDLNKAKKDAGMKEAREHDEGYGESENNPRVKEHNRAVAPKYRPRPRRPRIEDDPRFGTPRDRSGNWKY